VQRVPTIFGYTFALRDSNLHSSHRLGRIWSIAAHVESKHNGRCASYFRHNHALLVFDTSPVKAVERTQTDP
jgi:hypothetical protein